jgi:hypothetical protein
MLERYPEGMETLLYLPPLTLEDEPYDPSLTKDQRYNRSEKGRERWRRYRRKQYWQRKDAGLCTACGKNPIDDVPLILDDGTALAQHTLCITCECYKRNYDAIHVRGF